MFFVVDDVCGEDDGEFVRGGGEGWNWTRGGLVVEGETLRLEPV